MKNWMSINATLLAHDKDNCDDLKRCGFCWSSIASKNLVQSDEVIHYGEGANYTVGHNYICENCCKAILRIFQQEEAIDD